MKPTLICLTPVKNEAWIIERFLKCASLWADHIIVADQGSDDGTVEVAQSFPKVRLIRNEGAGLNEIHRQRLLLAEARKIPGPKILIALDADEFLTPNFKGSPEWDTMLRSPTGTVITFQWANICPDMVKYWIPPFDHPFGFVDDGSDHSGGVIHNSRIPVSWSAPILRLRQIKVMHYQFTDWDRMQSKHRWYQCWERINNPSKSAVEIYRQYHHMDMLDSAQLMNLPSEWIDAYTSEGIDMTSVLKDRKYRWDCEVASFFKQYGTAFFKKLDIWTIDWNAHARDCGCLSGEAALSDPRRAYNILFHKYLRATQKACRCFLVRILDRLVSVVQ